MKQATAPLSVGDRLNGFSLPATTGGNVGLHELVGGSLVVFFYLRDGGEGCTRQAQDFRDLHEKFREMGVRVVGIGVESLESHAQFAQANNLPFPLLSDSSFQAGSAFGVIARQEVNGAPVLALRRATFICDPLFRVLKSYLDVSPEGHAQQVLEDARKLLIPEEPRHLRQHAPVLLIPHVLPPDLCRRLIELWETQGNEESGFMRQVDGKTVGMTDYSHKIRRDHFMQTGTPEEEQVKHLVSNRVLPLIRQAFNYPVTRREDFRIACYDASRGGYFRPHRDNTTDGTAHRRFAMSLLLNDDYEGGWLRFPEYGRHRYRPDAGAAVIFSCSLLHEATDVTAGRRFVLLSFFYGEQEARMREEYSRRTGATYRA